jgi:VWFA-related protein
MNKRFFICCLLVFSVAPRLFAQDPKPQSSPPPNPPQAQQPAPPAQAPQPPAANQRETPDQDVIRITTNLVQVDVVVTKDGKQVTDLKPEEFEIFEDNKRQDITNFSYVTNTNRVDYSTSSGSLTSGVGATGPIPPKPIKREQVGRTMAIVVDDLGMSFESMARARSQLSKFISEKLEPTDLVAIIRTGGDVGALQQFTTDRRVLQNAVASLKWNPCSRIGASVVDAERSLLAIAPPEPQLVGRIPPDRAPSSAGVKQASAAGDPDLCRQSASIYYTIRSVRFILRGMSDLPGRKSMMLISDNLPTEEQEMSPTDFGFKRPVIQDATRNANLIDVWTQSKNYLGGLSRLAEVAIRSSVVIYGVASQRLQTLGPHPGDEISYPPSGVASTVRRRPGQEPDVVTRLIKERPVELRRNMEGSDLLAKQTGGFMIRNSNDFGFDKVLEDQGGYYLIGYRPAATTFDRKFHHIKARVKRDGVTVRTRAGFYGVTEAEAPIRPSTIRDRMDRALSSPFGASEIDVRVTPLFVNDPARGSILRLLLSFDGKDLTFTEEPDGSHVANLTLTTVFFGDNGAVTSKHDHKTTLRLRGRPFERAMRDGVVYTFDMPAKEAGVFQFRMAVVDVASARVGSAGEFLAIPDFQSGRLAMSGILLQGESHSSTAADSTADDDVLSQATLRRFRYGSSLAFGYTIYNASTSKGAARLTSQSTIFREGKKIYSSDSLPVGLKDQADMKRIAAGARLQLGAALTPGEYVLQITVNDESARRSVTQWIDFEVVR